MASISFVGGEFTVVPSTSNQAGISVAGQSDNSFLVAWTTNVLPGGYGTEVQGQLMGPNAVPIGVPFTINVSSSFDQSSPQLIRLDSERYLATYWSDGDFFGVLLSSATGDVIQPGSTGQALGPHFSINSLGFFPESHRPQTGVTVLEDGRFVVGWAGTDSFGEYNIWARIFNADASPVADQFIVNTRRPIP